jgi:ABC-type dipeptide/oligopeptide/nickel transport system permease subunit
VAILLTACGFLIADSAGPLHLETTRLTSGATWLPALLSDAQAGLGIMALALIGGPLLAALRLTILGDWLRRFGSLETLIWSPLPIWALAWSHGSGRVISMDLALSALAAVTVSIQLYSSVRRHSASPFLMASRTLGSTSWQAWCRHALRTWLREFLAFLISLFGFVWWLRIAAHCLLTTDKTTPEASLGSFLAHAATDALHHPLPLLSASLAAAVSILFLWSLGRIIFYPYPQSDDA